MKSTYQHTREHKGSQAYMQRRTRTNTDTNMLTFTDKHIHSTQIHKHIHSTTQSSTNTLQYKHCASTQYTYTPTPTPSVNTYKRWLYFRCQGGAFLLRFLSLYLLHCGNYKYLNYGYLSSLLQPINTMLSSVQVQSSRSEPNIFGTTV